MINDDRFVVYRTAHWIDQGLSTKEAMAKARAELRFKDAIEIPKKPPAPSVLKRIKRAKTN